MAAKIIKPNKADPIPFDAPRQNVAMILFRFVVFLALAVGLLLLAWLK